MTDENERTPSGSPALSARHRPTNANKGRSRSGRRSDPAQRSDKERQILACAAELFARKGFENTSINQIGAGCALSKPALYHYFRDKDAIYAGIVLTVLRDLCEIAERDIAAAPSAEGKLRAYMRSQSRYFEDRYCEYVSAQLGYRNLMLPEDRRVALRWRDKHESNLRQIIREGIASKEFRPVDVVTCGRVILSCLNWMVRWFRPGGGKHATEFADEYFDLLFSGIRSAA